MFGNPGRFGIAWYEQNPVHVDDYFSEDPNMGDVHGNTMLHKFIINRQHDPNVMQDLINRGANLELRNRTGKTVFLLAVVHRNRKMVEKLIQNGAHVNAQDYHGNHALHYLSLPELNDYFQSVDGEGYSCEDDEERVNFGDTFSILESLLKKMDVNLKNKQGETALMWAARGYHLNIIEMLLGNGADVNLQCEGLESCLHFASTPNPMNERMWRGMNLDIIVELIRNGATINCYNRGGRTPLGCILRSGHQNKNYFAMEFVKFAALNHLGIRIDFQATSGGIRGPSGQTLRIDSFMIPHIEACYAEIDRMANRRLSRQTNLCQFAQRGVTEAESDIEYQINERVLDILSRQTFPLFHEFIVYKLNKRYIHDIMQTVIISPIGERRIILPPQVNSIIASFLNNVEVCNILLAPRPPMLP